MNNLKQAMATAVMIAIIGFTEPSFASYQDQITEQFASGAVFNGIATFDDNLLVPTSIYGTLTGYQLGTAGFVDNSVSETISYVFDSTFNYANTPLTAVNWWLDVSPADVQNGSVNNSILFSIDFSNPLAPVFTPDDNGINTVSSNADFLVSGTIQSLPESSTIALFGLGFLGLGSRFIGLKKMNWFCHKQLIIF
ncbi:hypothetical protein [Methylomonas sp. AM2-LC]|uniref:hypothetical protein n=1 Tax=Methylomonas sp. AM2-LC TaxID=3153301 RepID=UPI0032630F90